MELSSRLYFLLRFVNFSGAGSKKDCELRCFTVKRHVLKVCASVCALNSLQVVCFAMTALQSKLLLKDYLQAVVGLEGFSSLFR